MDIASEYKVEVIEDAAQAIGAEYPSSDERQRPARSAMSGYFSFYPSKNLGAAGDAGDVVCLAANLATNLRTAASTEWSRVTSSVHRRKFPPRRNAGGDP